LKAAIVGIAGTALSGDEAALFRAAPPLGVILFARNIENPSQLRHLIAEVRRCLPRGALLMVDQEGGRVARLRPPPWRRHPPAAAFGALFAKSPAAGLRAAWLGGAAIGAEAAEAGFDVVAAPVLDRAVAGADRVVGDRAFGADPRVIARLARAFAAGVLAAGVQPVGKHAPGHGRATADSHRALPVVAGSDADAAADLLPFLANRDLPWMMTAHILYPAWDRRPATVSAEVIGRVVRERIGFGGVLVSDDLAMEALSGTPAERALAALAAGCDVALYCSGAFEPTRDLLVGCPSLAPAARARLAAARALAARRRLVLDAACLAAERDRLFG